MKPEMRLTIALVLLAVGVGSLLFTFVTHACARKVTRRARRAGPTPPISVLKPMKGADPDLYDNLASLAAQDYPEFELVLGCEDAMDPALGVARRLKRDFPHVPMTIVAAGRPVGHNPKVNNLVQLTRAARHDFVLVSDADVRAGPEYLRALAAETADPQVGLVSSVIAGVGERSFGATLDNLHMNGFIASTICGAEVLADHPCVVGKSMLLRRSVLQRLGGWALVKDVLAEDYLLGRAFHAVGLRVALSGYAIHAVAGARAFGAFFRRHLRWSLMRRTIMPWHHLGEPLLLPTPWLVAAIAVVLGAARTDRDALHVAAVALVCLGIRGQADSSLASFLRGVGTGSGARVSLLLPHPVDAVLVIVKDLIMMGVWLAAWFQTTVEWRGNVFRVGRASLLTPVTSSPEQTPARHGAR